MEFSIQSGFGVKTREPFIEFSVDGQVNLLSPADSRKIGLQFIEAAEAAQSDGLLVKLLEQKGMDFDAQVTILGAFRDLRVKEDDKG